MNRPGLRNAVTRIAAGNPLLPLVALAGFSASFQTIAALAAQHHLPGWRYQYPLGIDVGILALIIESRRAIADGRSDLVPRMLAWALSGFTIYINAHGSAAHDITGRALHVVMPSLWVAFLELTRWRQLRKARSGADRIPRARWFLSPWRTAGMRRRMVMNNITSYPVAVAREDARMLGIDLAAAVFGKDWKRDAPVLLRHHLLEGTLPEAISTSCEYAKAGIAEQVEAWITDAKTDRARAVAKVRREERAIEAPEPAAISAPGPRARKTRQTAAGDRAKRNAAARQLLTDNPAMLRADVAKQAGVSPRTVDRIKSEMPRHLHVAAEG